MDFELLPLLVGVAIGSLLGKGGKGMVKPLAKGYMTLSDRMRAMTANLREDLRDAVEEARYEHMHEMSSQEAHPAADGAETQSAAAQDEGRSVAPVRPSSARRRSGGSAAATEGSTTSRSRAAGTRRTGTGSPRSGSRSRAAKSEAETPASSSGEAARGEGAQGA